MQCRRTAQGRFIASRNAFRDGGPHLNGFVGEINPRNAWMKISHTDWIVYESLKQTSCIFHTYQPPDEQRLVLVALLFITSYIQQDIHAPNLVISILTIGISHRLFSPQPDPDETTAINQSTLGVRKMEPSGWCLTRIVPKCWFHQNEG